MIALLRTVPFISVFMFGLILTRTDGQGLETVVCNRLRCGFGATCEGSLCLCKSELSVHARLDTTPPLLYCKGVCNVTNRICTTSNTTCNTALGANTCDCSPGYTRSTSGHCLRNDDQCSSEPCGQSSVCTNTPGSFTCTCQTGFTSNTTSTLTDGCSDIDECTRNGSICGNNSTCTNFPGSFTCTCESGFTRRSTSDVTEGCVDVDECTTSSDICGGNSVCINTPGSFNCSCEPGFTPTSKQGCLATTTARTSTDTSITHRGGNVGSTVFPSVTKGLHSSRKTESTGTTLPLTAEGTSPSNLEEVVTPAAIVGTVLGAIIGLLLIGMVIYCAIRYRKSKKKTGNRPVMVLANPNTNLTIGREVGIYEIVSGPEDRVYATADTNSRNDARTYESLSSPSDNVSTNIMSPGDAHYGDQGYYNLDNMSPVYVNRDERKGGENGPVYTNM